MALRNLTVEEMVEITAAWVDPEDAAHREFQQAPRLAPLLVDVERAHNGIFAVVPQPENPRKAEIARLASEEDSVHDVLARGVHGFLTNLALLDDDSEAVLQLRDQLMPEGLASVVQTTYRGQAGFAKLQRKRITDGVREQLRSIPTRQDTLLDRVEAWLSAGERLGRLEEERARLEEVEADSVGVQTLDARNQWIRTVHAVLGLAELAELDEKTDRILFGPLRHAEEKASARAARRSAAAVPESVEGEPAESGTQPSPRVNA